MTYELVTTQAYRKAFRRLARSGSFPQKDLETLIALLCTGVVLPAKYRDHGLSGNLQGYRECHVRSDLLLMYTKDDEMVVLTLINVGSHATLFGA